MNTMKLSAQVNPLFMNPFSLDIITDRSQRKLWAVSTLTWIAIDIRDGAGGPIWTAQAVEAYDEESCGVEGFS